MEQNCYFQYIWCVFFIAFSVSTPLTLIGSVFKGLKFLLYGTFIGSQWEKKTFIFLPPQSLVCHTSSLNVFVITPTLEPGLGSGLVRECLVAGLFLAGPGRVKSILNERHGAIPQWANQLQGEP
ncbi:hypothetical protein CHARACLAT_002938 [Characodon lateralis]|uniref:Uncharacterized protein n=1 Tax=Characodon lateralis TaxID=208331 RepID=A0ABU7DPN4_9TELE|nr:hypothetical protein [Characodon lateralis]